MTRRVGPKGQVLIPKDRRVTLGPRPGDEVDIVLDGAGVRVELTNLATVRNGMLANHNLAGALEMDRLSRPR
jgi:AbrB family looped-hinge helix DNA binding protein